MVGFLFDVATEVMVNGFDMFFAGLLTKKFISLIQEAKDGTLDLNHTAEILQVLNIVIILCKIVIRSVEVKKDLLLL